MAEVNVSKDMSGRIIVSFPYSQSRVAKVKTIEGHKWHPEKKHWSFPSSDGVLQKILRVFDGEQIHLDPSVPMKLPSVLECLRQALRSRHYSRRTEQSYCHWVRRFISFHNGRHPGEMSEREINGFLTHLAIKERVSASTQTQALSALLSLYRHVVRREIGSLDGLIRARKPRRLPVVMTKDEVRLLINELKDDYHLIAR